MDNPRDIDTLRMRTDFGRELALADNDSGDVAVAVAVANFPHEARTAPIQSGIPEM